MIAVENIAGIFCDAYVDDQEFLIFSSLWGRDTAVQELLARLSLPLHEGGLNHLQLENDKTLRIGNPERLDKLTGRMPKTNIFGDLVHLWLFDRRTQKPDMINREAYLLWPDTSNDSQSVTPVIPEERIWELVKLVCHLPILDQWQDKIMALLHDQRWLTMEAGYRIHSFKLKLDEQPLEDHITGMIQSNVLDIDDV